MRTCRGDGAVARLVNWARAWGIPRLWNERWENVVDGESRHELPWARYAGQFTSWAPRRCVDHALKQKPGTAPPTWAYFPEHVEWWCTVSSSERNVRTPFPPFALLHHSTFRRPIEQFAVPTRTPLTVLCIGLSPRRLSGPFPHVVGLRSAAESH